MDQLEIVRPIFDRLKRLGPQGVEYWMARDLQGALGYARWENFEGVIEKARMACERTRDQPDNHILRTAKMIETGKGAQRERGDYYVSRYGAYLIAMNGGPDMPRVAAAQDYFAVQTRRQELADEQGHDIAKRIELRDRVRDANRHLGDAAKASGVQNWGLFHDAGYKGLYGLGLKAIKEQKGLDRKEELLDRAGRAELAANEFRITQTEQALTRDEIKGDVNARETHRKVGSAVRETIRELGGTMPEDLPPEPSIKKLATQRTKPQITEGEADTEDSSDSGA